MPKKRSLLLLDAAWLLLACLAPLLAKGLLALPTDCPTQRFGLQCPACGGTRCVQLLFQGSLLDAFWMNPYFFISICLLAAYWLLLHVSVFSTKHYGARLCRALERPRSAVIWAIGFACFGVLRNFF